MSRVYLNGSFVPVEHACVSVMDRGFLFGDGVYEVIPVYGGRLFRLSHHLQRLQNSLDGIRLHNPMSDQQWRDMLSELVALNTDGVDAQADQSVYLQVTRGVSPKRDHRFPDHVTPTVFAMSSPMTAPDASIEVQGVAAVTLDDTRWQMCNIKAITLLPNVLLRQQATEGNSAEAFLVRDGLVIEGSASNVFAVANGKIHTPPHGPLMLPGITRDLVLELAEHHGIPWAETDIPLAQLRAADEIWLTSSTREVVPVTRLDGQPVGEGRPGPVWHRMVALYRDYKDAVRRGEAV